MIILYEKIPIDYRLISTKTTMNILIKLPIILMISIILLNYLIKIDENNSNNMFNEILLKLIFKNTNNNKNEGKLPNTLKKYIIKIDKQIQEYWMFIVPILTIMIIINFQFINKYENKILIANFNIEKLYDYIYNNDLNNKTILKYYNTHGPNTINVVNNLHNKISEDLIILIIMMTILSLSFDYTYLLLITIVIARMLLNIAFLLDSIDEQNNIDHYFKIIISFVSLSFTKNNQETIHLLFYYTYSIYLIFLATNLDKKTKTLLNFYIKLYQQSKNNNIINKSPRILNLKSRYIIDENLKILPNFNININLSHKYYLDSDNYIDLYGFFKLVTYKCNIDSVKIQYNDNKISNILKDNTIWKLFIFLENIIFYFPDRSIKENLKLYLSIDEYYELPHILQVLDLNKPISQITTEDKYNIMLAILFNLAKKSYLIILDKKLFQYTKETTQILELFAALNICIISNHEYFKKYNNIIQIHQHQINIKENYSSIQ